MLEVTNACLNRNREEPDQTASSEAVWSCLRYLSMPFWQATSVRNFRTFTVTRGFYTQSKETKTSQTKYHIRPNKSTMHILIEYRVDPDQLASDQAS